MKPDTFTELIRRKLESIRPDVTERDWTRMQRSLQQAGLSGPPGAPLAGAGSMPSWLLTVAGIGTAALLAVTVWQRSEINTLRQKLTQQTTTPATATAPATLNDAEKLVDAPPRPDTVYLTRYVPVEPADRPQRGETNRSDPSGSVSKRAVPRLVPVPPANQPVIDNRAAQTSVRGAAAIPARQPDDALPGNSLSDNTLPNSTVPNNSLANTDIATNVPLAQQSRLAAPTGVETAKTSTGSTSTNRPDRSPATRPAPTQLTNRTTALTERDGGMPHPTETVSATSNAAVNPSATPENQVYALARTRSLLTRPVNWNARLARRLPRPAAVSQPESPRTAMGASQSVAKPATAFRVGVGSDLRAGYWNTGILAETVLCGRWVVSAGLVRSGSLLGTFVTDDDYDYRTRRNFRREFAPGFDQKREIYGIDVRSVRYQIPVSLGYRIPVSKSLSLLPSVGAYLDLSNSVQVAFSYRTPSPRPGYETATFQGKGVTTLLNAYTAGAALEWQQKHWLVQGGLLFARPLYSDLNGTAAPSLGGRVRLLYQF